MRPESFIPRHPELTAADWYRALRLTERLAGAGTLANANSAGTSSERARKRLSRWKSETPFAKTPLFSERLAADGIVDADLLALLAESAESLRDRRCDVPAWLAEIDQAFSQPPGETIPWPEEFRSPQASGFLRTIQPLIESALRELRDRVGRLVENQGDLPFDPAAVGSLFLPHLPQRLLGRLSRTLVLELNVARIQGNLAGETPEDRFASFITRQRSPENMLVLLREYPVLARDLVQCLDHWVAACVEFLERLIADWPAIRQTFCSGDTPDLLTEVKADAGDRHRQGRSVFLLRFESGLRLVYKPKSLAVDANFDDLLAWIRARAATSEWRAARQEDSTVASSAVRTLHLRIPRVLNRGRYGWVEFVAAATCQAPEEVHLFYRRQGAYLALLYALAAIDFHHENLIARGDHPIPVDLEALFHPVGLKGDRKGADVSANLVLYNSVFGVALLPGRIWSNPESEGVDISGLGAMPGQLMPFAGPAWEAEGTDHVRLIRKRHALDEAQNRPTLRNEPVRTLDYADDLFSGFRAMYEFLQNHRRELLSADGPLARFENDEVRVVVRATRSYAELLRESFHPDVLRDALDRDRLFDRLWNGAEESSNMARLIPAERDDLWSGDVPIFTTRPNSRDLWISAGDRIGGVLEESGMLRARRRIEAMGADDLAQQLWFIRASLATLAPAESRPDSPVYVIPQSPPSAGREQFLSVARAIGDRLEKLAVRGENDVSWIGLGFVRERSWSLVPLGVDFYDGLPGVAFFLGYLGAVTGEKRYTQLARGALTTVRNGVGRRPEAVPSIGAFGGWGGLIYTWMHLSTLWEDAELLAEARDFVGHLPEQIDKDENLDLIDGSAGCLLALLGLERCLAFGGGRAGCHGEAHRTEALAAAVRCGDRLLATTQAMDAGVAWPTRVPSTGPLTGMSHGTAGIAWALASLAARTGERRFAETARQALAYERSLFSFEKKKWADLRNFDGDTRGDRRFTGMTAWCHGAAGIGLARLAILEAFMQSGSRNAELLNDGLMREEIETALATTCAEGFGWNHTLCHGDLGNIELLVLAGRVFGNPHWRTEAERISSGIIDRIQRHGWICANPAGIDSPGLMTGLAGIAYGLLSLADPDRVPSILVLDGPASKLPGRLVANCGTATVGRRRKETRIR